MSDCKAGTPLAEVRVLYGAWYAEEELSLRFPVGWEVHRLDPDDAPALSPEAVEAAFAAPVGGPRIRQAARGKRSAVVAVDDLTRPTPAHAVLSHVLQELAVAGVPAQQTRILLGTAAHRPMQRHEIERKLGPGVAARFEVVRHDFTGADNRFLGWMDGGPVHLNRHFLDAEVRICVGGVIPHNETGFGGGSKMVLPGLAGRHTIAHFHGALPPRLAGVLEAADGVRDRRVWSETVARRVGVDAVVACALNARRALAGVYVGDLVKAHRMAARQAAAIGRTAIPRALADGCDVVVVNAYPLDTDPIQMGKSLNLARKLRARCSVVVNAASDSVFYHGMGMGSGVQPARLVRNLPRWLAAPRDVVTFARSLGAALTKPLLAARLGYFTLNYLSWQDFERGAGDSQSVREHAWRDEANADPLVLSNAFPEWGFQRKYPRGRLYRRWDELAAALERRFPGEPSGRPRRALVFPCAPLQLLQIIDS